MKRLLLLSVFTCQALLYGMEKNSLHKFVFYQTSKVEKAKLPNRRHDVLPEYVEQWVRNCPDNAIVVNHTDLMKNLQLSFYKYKNKKKKTWKKYKIWTISPTQLCHFLKTDNAFDTQYRIILPFISSSFFKGWTTAKNLTAINNNPNITSVDVIAPGIDFEQVYGVWKCIEPRMHCLNQAHKTELENSLYAFKQVSQLDQIVTYKYEKLTNDILNILLRADKNNIGVQVAAISELHNYCIKKRYIKKGMSNCCFCCALTSVCTIGAIGYSLMMLIAAHSYDAL